jgi:hypothetical protein
MRIHPLCVVAGVLALGDGAARAAAFAVDDLTDAIDVAPGDGVCATARNTCTLRAAIQETNALAGADQIILAVGVHELTIGGIDEDAAATGDLDITDDLTIAGANAFLSIIDANGIDRVLDQRAPTDTPLELILRDLTITGGDTDSSGGGLRYSSSVDAERIIVTGNAAVFGGGGLAATDGPFDEPALDLRVSIVSLNSAHDGGGIDASFSAALSVDLSIIIANSALGDGGGVAYSGVDEEPARLERTTVYGNSSTGGGFPRGGGIRSGTNLLVDRSWIGHNLLGSWGAAAPSPGGIGGGLFVSGIENAITNSTIEGNLATDGGGLGVNGEVTLTHVTVARNGGQPGGAALRQFGGGADTRLQNTILAENAPANCSGLPFVSLGHNLSSDASCGLAGGGDIEDVDPQLDALGNYGGPTRTIPPMPGSQAIEGGTDAGIDVDQRGVVRPQLVQFDIGAVELEGRRVRERHPGGFTSNPHVCDLDRNSRVDFADLDRLIASFPVAGGRFRGDAEQRLEQCVASCTYAGCPAVPLIRQPSRRR